MAKIVGRPQVRLVGGENDGSSNFVYWAVIEGKKVEKWCRYRKITNSNMIRGRR